jgi:hypothetical protein
MVGTEDVIAEPLVLLLELADHRLWAAHQRQPIVELEGVERTHPLDTRLMSRVVG